MSIIALLLSTILLVSLLAEEAEAPESVDCTAAFSPHFNMPSGFYPLSSSTSDTLDIFTPQSGVYYIQNNHNVEECPIDKWEIVSVEGTGTKPTVTLTWNIAGEKLILAYTGFVHGESWTITLRLTNSVFYQSNPDQSNQIHLVKLESQNCINTPISIEGSQYYIEPTLNQVITYDSTIMPKLKANSILTECQPKRVVLKNAGCSSVSIDEDASTFSLSAEEICRIQIHGETEDGSASSNYGVIKMNSFANKIGDEVITTTGTFGQLASVYKYANSDLTQNSFIVALANPTIFEIYHQAMGLSNDYTVYGLDPAKKINYHPTIWWSGQSMRWSFRTDLVMDQVLNFYFWIRFKTDHESTRQYLLPQTFAFQVKDPIIRSDMVPETPLVFGNPHYVYMKSPTSGCTANARNCGIVHFPLYVVDGVKSTIAEWSHNETGNDTVWVKYTQTSTSTASQFEISTTHKLTYQLSILPHTRQQTMSEKSYRPSSVYFLDIKISCGLETITITQNQFKLRYEVDLTRTGEVSIDVTNGAASSDTEDCPLILTEVCNKGSADANCLALPSSVSLEDGIDDTSKKFLRLNTDVLNEGAFIEGSIRYSTEAKQNMPDLYASASLIIVFCRKEVLVPKNANEKAYLFLKPEAGGFTLSIDEIFDELFTADFTDSYFECAYAGNYELLEPDCQAPLTGSSVVYLEKDPVTQYVIFKIDISAPVLSQLVCLKVTTLGEKVAQTQIVVEVCGVGLGLQRTDYEWPVIAIDGSHFKYIFKRDIELLFDNPSDNCTISSYDFLQADSSKVTADEEANFAFNLLDAKNFMGNTFEPFSLVEDTALKEDILITMENALFFSMEKDSSVSLQRYVRVNLLDARQFVQPIKFTFTKTYDYPPYYEQFPYGQVQIKVDQRQQLAFQFKSYSYGLPQAKDREGGEIEVDLDKQGKPWIELKEASGTYTIEIEDQLISERDAGQTKFAIKLSNPGGEARSYSFKVLIKYILAELEDEDDSEGESEGGDEEDDGREVNEAELPSLEIGSISTNHKLQLKFNRPMEFDPAKNFSSAMSIAYIGESGRVKGTWIPQAEAGKRLLRSNRQGARHLVEEGTELQEFAWTLAQPGIPEELEVQLIFEDPFMVSARSYEEIKVYFKDSTLFKSVEGAPLRLDHIESSCGSIQFASCMSIPPFLSQQTKEQLEATATIYDGSIKSLTASNIFIVIFFGGTLQHIWSVIRPLQHLSVLGLISIIYPANLFQYFSMMKDISEMDIFFGETINEYLFQFKESQPFNSFFENFGISTQIFLLNSGSIVLPLIPILALQAMAYFVLMRCGVRLHRFGFGRRLGVLSKQFHIDLVVSFFTLVAEGFIELVLAVFMGFDELMSVETYSEMRSFFTFSLGSCLSTILTIFFFLLVLSTPFMVVRAALNYKQGEEFSSFEKVFFERVSMKRPVTAMVEGIVLLNKLTIVAILIKMSHLPLLQLFMIFFTQFFVLNYLAWVRPYTSRAANWTEGFDQLTIFLVLYPMIVLTNPSLNPVFKERCGWFVVFSISFNILANLSNAIYSLTVDMLEIRREKKKVEMQKKEIENHILNRKKIIMQFPGLFPQFESYVDFHLSIRKSQQWMEERQWLLDHGVPIHKMSQEVDFQRLLRKHSLFSKKVRAKKWVSHQEERDSKRKNKDDRAKRSRVYSRLKEYHLKHHFEEGDNDLTSRPYVSSRQDRLEVINETDSQKDESIFDDVHPVGDDVQRLVDLKTKITDPAASNSIFVQALNNEMKPLPTSPYDIIEFVPAPLKILKVNPYPYFKEHERLEEINRFLLGHDLQKHWKPCFDEDSGAGLVCLKASRELAAMMQTIFPLERLAEHYVASFKPGQELKGSSALFSHILRLYRSVPRLEINEAINLPKELTAFKASITGEEEHVLLAPFDFLIRLSKELETEHDFKEANPTSYSQGHAFQFLEVLNSKAMVLTLQEELRVLENYVLELPNFLQKCFSSLSKKIVCCTSCGAAITATWKSNFGYSIDTTKAYKGPKSLRDYLEERFMPRQVTNSTNLKCPGCHRRGKHLAVQSKIAVPPLYLMVKITCFDQSGGLLPLSKEAFIDDAYLELREELVDPAWFAFKQQGIELKHVDEYSEETKILRRGSLTYELVSVVFHQGSTAQDGQFYTLSKHSHGWVEHIEGYTSPIPDVEEHLKKERLSVTGAIFKLIEMEKQPDMRGKLFKGKTTRFKR